MIPILLGDLFQLKYGKSLRKDTRREGDIPVFGSSGQVGFHSESLVSQPTIIVGRKGSIGEVHLATGPSWPIDTTYFVESIGKHEFNLNWLYRLLGTLRLQELNRSAAIPGLNREDVYRIPVLLPPLADQARIAGLLATVEELIAGRKKLLQQLDDLLKAVFLDMFGDSIKNPRHFAVRRLSEFYVNPKAGTKCGPFGSALKKDELVDSGVPVWNMDNIGPSGQMALPFRMWITQDKYKELEAYSVQDGDILISRAGTVGKMCIAQTQGQPAIISTNLIRLRLGSDLRPLHFVSLMLYCKGRVGRLKVGADGAFTHMNTGILDSLEFPYPPIELQDRFGAIASQVQIIRSAYQQSLANLESLYGALSQQAFKGELDLSRVPFDAEPHEPHAAVPTAGASPAAPPNAIHLPDTELLLATLEDHARLKDLLPFWLEAYRDQLSGAAFSVPDFLAAAQTRIAELHPDSDFELGADAYEEIKAWVFKALASGRLRQGYPDADNRVTLASRLPDGERGRS